MNRIKYDILHNILINIDEQFKEILLGTVACIIKQLKSSSEAHMALILIVLLMFMICPLISYVRKSVYLTCPEI